MGLQLVVARFMVDQATVYGYDEATGVYDQRVLRPFMCRVRGRSQATLGSGIGALRTSGFRLLYPSDVDLPPGYWEIDIGGIRYTPVANSGAIIRGLAGVEIWRSIDLDQLNPNSH